ncbi:MAG: hypothetical protein AAGA43_10140 [Bacteroidota bacterium]
MKRISILFLSLFVLASCSNDDETIDKSGAKAMTSFVFTAEENDALSTDMKATIDEEKKTITAEFSIGTDVTSLKPTITISEDAKVSPGDKEAKDFSEVVTYTVTAEDATEAKYTVTVTVGKSDAKAITSFVFKAEDNEGLSEDVEAEIEDTEKTILARVPFGTDIAALKPSIEISERAAIFPDDQTAQDFSKTVIYTVTAEDSTESSYEVEVEVLKSDRQVLIELYNANPNNDLDWDLDDEDISNWEGITLEDGRVVEIIFEYKRIEVLPSSIGDLTKLRYFYSDSSDLTILPAEIGKLQSLEYLNVGFNQLTEIPDEIGQLSNLQELRLGFNPEIKELPSTLGNLSNLRKLSAYETGLTEMPSWIGNLTNLNYLDFGSNEIEGLPNEIGLLQKLDTLNLYNNKIKTLPPEIGNLIALKDLTLGENELKELPQEFRNLSSLSSLVLSYNEFDKIPEVINKLNGLTDLYLSFNKIDQVNPGFSNLENLDYLDLGGNALTTLPEEFGRLQKLKVLILQKNKFVNYFPFNFSNLAALKTLYLNDNKLVVLNEEIAGLTQLEYLYIQNNDIPWIFGPICDMNLVKFVRDANVQCNYP